MGKLINTVEQETIHTVELTQSEWNTISLVLGRHYGPEMDELSIEYNIPKVCKTKESYDELYELFRRERA